LPVAAAVERTETLLPASLKYRLGGKHDHKGQKKGEYRLIGAAYYGDMLS